MLKIDHPMWNFNPIYLTLALQSAHTTLSEEEMTASECGDAAQVARSALSELVALVDTLYPLAPETSIIDVSRIERIAKDMSYIRALCSALSEVQLETVSEEDLENYIERIKPVAGEEIHGTLHAISRLNDLLLAALGQVFGGATEDLHATLHNTPDAASRVLDRLTDLDTPAIIRLGVLQGLCMPIYTLLIDRAAHLQADLSDSGISKQLGTAATSYMRAIASYASLHEDFSPLADLLRDFVISDIETLAQHAAEIQSYAQELADSHYKLEPNLALVAAIVDEDQQTLLLVEVNADTIPTGFAPLGFRSSLPTLRRVLIADLTPEEWEQYKQGKLVVRGGWDRLPPMVLQRPMNEEA